MPKTPEESIQYWRDHSLYVERLLANTEKRLHAITAYARVLEELIAWEYQTTTQSEERVVTDLRSKHGIADDMMTID